MPTKTQSLLTNDGSDTLTGGLGNDTFIFNTLLTGIDIIKDFTVEDNVRIDGNQFAKDVERDTVGIDDFLFDRSNGALTFNSQQFATVENFNDLNGVNLAFSKNQDTGIITFGINS